MCRCGGGGWGSRIRSVSRPRCSPASASRRLADARALVTEMPATLDALGGWSGVGAGGAGGDHRDAVPDPGGPRPGRCRARSGGGVDVGARDQPGGAAAGDRTRPGRRRPPGGTGSGGPVRVHPTPARHDGQDHRRPARWNKPWPASRHSAQAAESAKATGDERTKAQIKADTLVERITGQATATAIPVEVQLVMTSDALLGRSEEPAQLPGHGPLPAFLARRIITRDPDATAARVWVRRLLTDPIDDTVATIDTKRRRFDGALAVLINARDQVCRDPYCSAPIRDLDHLHDLRERWAHQRRQRDRALPTREPGRPDPRLAHHRHRQTPGGDHPHRTPLRHPTTTRPRTPTTHDRQTNGATPTRRLDRLAHAVGLHRGSR